MIHLDKMEMRYCSKQYLTHYWVTCDRCGHGRWKTPAHIRLLDTDEHLCRGCTTSKRQKERALEEFPSVVKDGRYWKVPIACPDCKETRLVRPSRARKWGTEHPCKICARRRIGRNSKVGIRTKKGKTCSRCKQFKLYTEFYPSVAADGYQSRCKDCDLWYVRRQQRVRHARIRSNGGNFTTTEWDEICEAYGNVCLLCGEAKPLTVDHIIPVSLGGASDPDNLQPLCKSCNSIKGTTAVDYRPFPF